MSFYPAHTLSLVLCFAAWQATAQNPVFTSVIAAGGEQPSSGNAIVVDPAGNSYVTGSFGFAEFGGTIDLGTTNLVSTGESDGFVAKFSPQGQCLWARQIAGLEQDDAYDVVLRSDGTILITGEFLGTNAIGNATLVSHGGFDIFLAAFSPAGNLLWARAIGGTLDDFALALAGGPGGSALFTGSFSGDIDLGGGITFSSADDDALLIKLTTSGSVQWARTGSGGGLQLGSDVKVDAQGNVFWAGEFETNVTFGATSLTHPEFKNVFLAKYDTAGNRQWARKLGEGEEADLPRLALASDGRLVCTAVYFGDYAITGQDLPAGAGDVLVASFAPAGDLQWVTSFGGNELDVCTELLLDAAGDCYLAGHFRGTMPVGNTNLVSAGSTDIFVVRCSRTGQLQAAVRAGGLSPDLAFSGITASPGALRLTGSFSGTAQFGSISVNSADGLPKTFLATMALPPTLRITGYPTHVLLSWPTNFSGFTLQSKSALSAASWNPVTTTAVIINGEFVVTNQVSDPTEFFRLRN